ncbi:hypothetical protein IL306_004258 [Fusarium sp. DS 682]|nr:hypothetical protein IL306_004258 [Fusarium sp. DS 682]
MNSKLANKINVPTGTAIGEFRLTRRLRGLEEAAGIAADDLTASANKNQPQHSGDKAKNGPKKKRRHRRSKAKDAEQKTKDTKKAKNVEGSATQGGSKNSAVKNQPGTENTISNAAPEPYKFQTSLEFFQEWEEGIDNYGHDDNDVWTSQDEGTSNQPGNEESALAPYKSRTLLEAFQEWENNVDKYMDMDDEDDVWSVFPLLCSALALFFKPCK